MVPVMTESIVEAIRRYAGAHANVATSIACEGTALEATTFNVAAKAFLFLRTVEGGQEVRLKLGASRPQIEKLGVQSPETYSIGSSGWAKVIVSEARALALMERWIAESYALIAGKPGGNSATRVTTAPPASRPAPAKQFAPNQPLAFKPAVAKLETPAVKKPLPVPANKAAPPMVKAAKPAAKKPVAKKPAPKKPAAKKPTAKTPAAKTPAAKRPAAKKPAAKKRR